jgi:glycosyltransferase involved in cell wall biosynthesis
MHPLVEPKGLSALLVGDRRFIKVGQHNYTEGPSGPETGERYLRWFDQVTVAGRAGDAAGVDISKLNRLDEAGLAVEPLPNLSGIGAILRSQGAARRRLEQLVQQHDALICRMPTQLGLLALHTALRLGKPVAADLGGCAYDGLRAHGSLRGWLYAPISYRRVRAGIAKCQWVSYVTQNYLQARYPAFPGAKVVACSNVDVPSVPLAVLVRRLERESAADNGLVFGTIGSLHTKYKGIQHAFAALGRLRNELPEFQYRVLGGGDKQPWMQQATRHGLQGNVRFDGTLPSGQPVFDWLDSINVYLHPSLTEGVPRAVIEAMGRGCAVIASNVGGTPELLPAEVLHDPGDVDRLCELLCLGADPGFRQSAARRNFETAQEYSREKLLARRDRFWGAFAEAARQQKSVSAKE